MFSYLVGANSVRPNVYTKINTSHKNTSSVKTAFCHLPGRPYVERDRAMQSDAFFSCRGEQCSPERLYKDKRYAQEHLIRQNCVLPPSPRGRLGRATDGRPCVERDHAMQRDVFFSCRGEQCSPERLYKDKRFAQEHLIRQNCVLPPSPRGRLRRATTGRPYVERGYAMQSDVFLSCRGEQCSPERLYKDKRYAREHLIRHLRRHLPQGEGLGGRPFGASIALLVLPCLAQILLRECFAGIIRAILCQSIDSGHARKKTKTFLRGRLILIF